MTATYRHLIDHASALLSASSDSPRTDAQLLLQHSTGRELAWLLAYGDESCPPAQHTAFVTNLAARQSGQPIAYILGYQAFWTLKLTVNQQVLIPRADTEVLVEQALTVIDQHGDANILDLGTGSGAIALALASERPCAKVLAVDAQPKALAVAQANAQHHQLNNVDFLISDWFSALGSHRFDLIAANPPYVQAHDPHLQRGDLRFEPDTALIAAQHGLADLREIITKAPRFLKPAGWLIVEHGYSQQQAVTELFKQQHFHHISCHQDLNQLPRCTLGQLGSSACAMSSKK